MSTTIFFAVQCYQCSTMQVKQKSNKNKHVKTNNKWRCVVCNEKQSVRKVFAEGYVAKDLRNFVQSFNMSRKVDDELRQRVEEEEEEEEENREEEVEDRNCFVMRQSRSLIKRRTDWSEYLEDVEEVENANVKCGDNGGNFDYVMLLILLFHFLYFALVVSLASVAARLRKLVDQTKLFNKKQ